MIVMGGIIGGGIFVNPAEVARRVGSPGLAQVAWAIGGAIALIGAFVYAELAARRPQVGGQYAYLRDAYHPLTLMALTVINCIGVRAGSNVQSFFMVVKLVVIATVVFFGFSIMTQGPRGPLGPPATPGGGPAIGLMTALVPILFTYGGWQTASFVSGEMRDPRKDLPRGLLAGVIGVVIVYLLVNTAFLAALGIDGLSASKAPASDVMRAVLGERGARFIAAGVAISTVGFLSQSMLTAPRVYFAMARDGVFFRRIGELGTRSRVPVAAIVLQGVCASAIALWGRFDQVLNYVVSIDVLFFGLTGAALLVYRRRAEGSAHPPITVPLHPVTTIAFVAACWAISITTVVNAPRDAGGGVAILALGVPVYYWWARRKSRASV